MRNLYKNTTYLLIIYFISSSFDHHNDPHHPHLNTAVPDRLGWNHEAKRPKMDIKLEHDDVNDGYCFPEAIRTCKESTTYVSDVFLEIVRGESCFFKRIIRFIVA